MHTFRRFVPLLLALLLCTQGGHVLAEQKTHPAAAEKLVINADQSSLLRQALYLEDLNAALTPLLTPELLLWIGTRDREASEKLTALLAARPKEITLLISRKDYLATLELPDGNLEALADGEVTETALSAAFGPQASPHILALFTQNGGAVKANVQPGLHQLRADCFYTVVGKRLLLGSTEILVEVARTKLRAGNHITAIPAKGQHFWSKSDLQLNCGPSEQGPFVNKNFSYEYTLHTTPDGFTYSATSNAPDILPALETLAPLTLDDILLFGNQKPFYSLVFSPKLLEILTRVRIQGLPDTQPGLPQGAQLPLPFDDFERLGFFWGGAKAQALGYPIPGIMLAVKGKPETMTMLQTLLVGTAPAQWVEKALEGWQAFFTADMLLVDQTPIPLPMFFGRKEGELALGIMTHNELGVTQDSSVLLTRLPDDVKTCAVVDMDVRGFWTALAETLKPGSALRLIAKMDSHLTPAQVKAVDAILLTPPPLEQVTAWYSPDLRRAEGTISLRSKEQGEFLARLCALVDAFVPQ